ncbi:SDR family NAD(P)-dependent oxidoreductase [Mastigocladopsis repens]|uniref:SDR family NAD(P)-dependent oxidoreductase n=1 Tax=Mastigocladopsis repens TaxID=221287 RepID=UPI00031AD71D|nr:SDR family oxidoreductase [Mastigocladopsis repens]
MSRKTAIVTGASSGIGLGIVKTLLAEDYSVVACARKLSSAKVLDQTDRCFLIDGDVSLKATGESLTDVAIQKTGRLDLVVNNAGIFVPGNFHDYTEEQYRSIMATNADGFFYVTQPAVRQMRTQGRGHVVTISTTLVTQPVAGLNAFGTYFSKGALNAATKSLAIEYATTGIRFNTISAGIIDTPMHQPESHEFLKGLHPIARLGTVGEIVTALLYLEGAEFVTGEILHVDGGAHAGKW